jgi:hypothetical protein
MGWDTPFEATAYAGGRPGIGVGLLVVRVFRGGLRQTEIDARLVAVCYRNE